MDLVTRAGVERRLAAVLAADVAGYSRRMGVDEEGTLAALNAHLDRQFRPAVSRCNGRIVKTTGDGVLAVFASALDATRCALEIQGGIAEGNRQLAQEARLRFRIGINLGDIIVQDGDIFGNGVNVAARLEGLARPGGICISGDVYRQVRGKLDCRFQSLGDRSVRNIAEPVEVYRIAVDGEEAPRFDYRMFLSRGNAARIFAAACIGILIAFGAWLGLSLLHDGATVDTVPSPPAGLPLPERPSIAILPFENLGVSAGQERLGDSLAENLIAAMSSLPGMFVIARSSSFSYKGTPVKLQRVAEELGVRYVLEGSVQANDGRVRITARLVNAATGQHVWNEKYDRRLLEVFALQDEITLSIVTALQIELTEGELARTRRRGTDNLDAWLLVSESLESHQKFTKEANKRSRELAERALALDPGYPEALIRLARVHLTDFQTGWVADREAALQRSIELVQQALALDDTYPDAYVALGGIYLFVGRHDDAIAFAERAIELSPNHSLGMANLAMIQNYAGHPDEAITLLRTAMRLSPHYPDWFLSELGRAYFLTGQYDKAIAALQERLRQNPESSEGQIMLAAAFGAAGRTAEAQRVLARFLDARPGYNLSHYAGGEFYKNNDDLNRVLEGLRKAGLPEGPPS